MLQVRREKISERMKLLQDLVPGCSKVSFNHIRSFCLSCLSPDLYFFTAELNEGYRKGSDVG